MSKEAMKMALEWIEAQPEPRMLGALKTITALRQAIREAEEQAPWDAYDKAIAEQTVCDYCNHPLYAGTKCKNCGRVTEQAAIKRDLTPEQPAQPTKLKVKLEDRPIDIELAQYKRMFEAACSALGQIGDALGCDPEEGGAEPILAAIAELKAEQPAQQEPVACKTLCELCVKRGYHFCANAAQTTPIPSPQAQRTWAGLTGEEVKECFESVPTQDCQNYEHWRSLCARNIEAKLKEKNT